MAETSSKNNDNATHYHGHIWGCFDVYRSCPHVCVGMAGRRGRNPWIGPSSRTRFWRVSYRWQVLDA